MIRLRRLKELERENLRLRKAVSDLTLDKMILAEAAKGKLRSAGNASRDCYSSALRVAGRALITW